MGPGANLNLIATRLQARSILKKYLEPLRELRSIDKKLRIAISLYAIYLITRLLSDLPYTLYSLIQYRNFYNLEDFFVFENFISIIALIAIYLSLKNNVNPMDGDKEKVLTRNLASVGLMHYILDFYIVKQVIELRPVNARELPQRIPDFLPIDWFTLKFNFGDFSKEFYSPYDYVGPFEFSIALISAIAITLAIVFFFLYLKSVRRESYFKLDISLIFTEFNSKGSRSLVTLILIPFLALGNMNIQGQDFYSISFGTRITQEDLVEFKNKVPSASSELTATEVIQQRKFFANNAYKVLVENEKMLTRDSISFWSPDSKDLRVELLAWVDLWKIVLKELALNGYAEKASVFELQQKYKEISGIALNRAPRLTESFTKDFWREEFVTPLTY